MEEYATIVCGSPHCVLPRHLSGFLIGADSGALKLVDAGYTPNLAIGDFDSVSKENLERIKIQSEKVVILPCEKDITDTEAAIDYGRTMGFKSFFLYGATGGRFDHQYVLIALVLKYIKLNVSLYLIDEQNHLSILQPGTHQIKKNKKYLSFFALENTVIGLTIRNVKYPLEDYLLTIDNALCVSNEFLDTHATICFHSGFLLVIQSND